MFIGRDRELENIGRVLDAAQNGRGGLRAVSGEAGIGKTRLADEAVARASALGFCVSWGRAWETGGAPAYFPWIELLGPVATLGVELPARVAALLRASSHASLDEGTRADPARERFELFEAVGSYLRACARKVPLLLVFDDLHAADTPTLELLGSFARGLRSSRIAVLCTYRDAEARLPPVADLLARIAREGEVLALHPLSGDEVAEVVRHELACTDPALSPAIHALTEGNPLFLHEAIRALGARKREPALETLRDLAASGGVLALARSRLAGADAQTRSLLELAAALGRDWRLSLLSRAAGRDERSTRLALEDALARGLLVRRNEERWAFSHLLVREAFYRELTAERRRELHRTIALVLEQHLASRTPAQPGVHGEPLLAMLAHHAIAALPLGDPVAAVRVACRAAAQARSQLAYEEAMALLERARATCEEHGVEPRERAEVTLAHGWAATEAGQPALGRELFREVAQIARAVGDASLLARAALGQGGEYVLAEIRSELIEALREALQALGEGGGEAERRLRACLLARLAAALTPSETPAEPLGLARVALSLTQGETDTRTRIDVDVGVGAALSDFAPPDERIQVNSRLLRDARRLEDRVLELRALTRLACDYHESGDVARSLATISARATLASSIGHPRYLWQSPLLRSMQAMPLGRFEACEAYIVEARELARQASDPNAERCIEMHRFALLLLAGRLEAARAQEANVQRTLVSLRGNEYMAQWITAITAARLGDKARAAKALRVLGSKRANARLERAWLIETAVLADVPEIYTELYPTFAETDDTNVCWGPFGFAGIPPIARVLAMADFALGRRDEALGHCERALALCDRTGAEAYRVWVQLTLGEGTGEAAPLAQALELAERLDMPEAAARARALLARSGGGARSTDPEPSSMRPAQAFALHHDRERGEWTVEHAGQSFRLKDVRGLGMLAQLIEQPGREIHALDLASGERVSGEAGAMQAIDLGDAGPVIDARTRDAYRARIADLRDELAEAERWSDAAREARLREELEALSQQIAAAVGLGGRERRSGSVGERARIAVQRRIREAIKKIGERDAELGRHLDWTVRTGSFCAYEPDGRKGGR